MGFLVYVSDSGLTLARCTVEERTLVLCCILPLQRHNLIKLPTPPGGGFFTLCLCVFAYKKNTPPKGEGDLGEVQFFNLSIFQFFLISPAMISAKRWAPLPSGWIPSVSILSPSLA